MASKDHKKFYGPPHPAYEIVNHIIDIDNEPEDVKTTEWNIYKVPCNLRSLNESAYTPQLFSIGPLHFGQEKLNPMQKQKLRYLNLFRCRVKNIKDMDDFKKYLKRREDDIRQCYAEKLSDDINEEKLVDMMLLDSVFIMELFLRIQRQKSDEEESKNNNVKKRTYSDDIIVKQSWLNKNIQRDLLLLENQVPLFILQELYNIVPDTDPDKKPRSFIELAHDYFDSYHTDKKTDSCSDQEAARSCFNGKPSKDNNTSSASGIEKKSSSRFTKLKENWDNNYEPKHFTDLIRSFYICKKNLNDFKEGFPLKTATKLRESGVSFEKVDNKPLLDIKFQKIPILSWFLCLGCFPNSTYFKARLQIPELKVDDTTEYVLRNLIAFEQCHYPNQPYICNYVSFIDSLIYTKDDVDLLVEKEIIRYEVGSDNELATFVNGLRKYVVSDITCYADDIKDLNKHYQNQWYRTMAALRLVYFRDV